ncbi:MAG: hypothetical protein GXY19_20260 [Phycisphaerae bacterium]|nr:hypothetical protein [Phycisphaerae bacterium]
MAKADIFGQLVHKGADIEAVAEQVVEHPECIGELVEALQSEKGTARYTYEKVLRRVSERRPELVYPWFDVFAAMLNHDNSFLKWGAIMTIANLASVDSEGKFDAIFEKYYAPIRGPVMVTAANIIGSSPKIARAKPHLAERIAREVLRVRKAKYESHGRPSPECRNVAIGHAVEAFDGFFDQISDKASVLEFVKSQLKNTRKPVVKKAERFLRRHAS